MQIFLPYSNIIQSLECLDNKRLNKQITEAMQILKTNATGPFRTCKCDDSKIERTPWYNHPAVIMVRGYEDFLKQYISAGISIWCNRGFKNNRIPPHYELPIKWPKWFGDKKFHSSHRSNLLRKDKNYYGQFGWKEPDDLPYFWPSKNGY